MQFRFGEDIPTPVTAANKGITFQSPHVPFPSKYTHTHTHTHARARTNPQIVFVRDTCRVYIFTTDSFRAPNRSSRLRMDPPGTYSMNMLWEKADWVEFWGVDLTRDSTSGDFT